MLKEILDKPDSVPFQAAQRIRSRLLEEVRSEVEPLSTAAKRNVSQLASSIDEAMESTARIVGGEAEQAWRAANQFMREGAERYGTNLAREITRAQPEAVVDLVVKRGKPGTIRTLRETIADPETWSKVQGTFMEQLIDLTTDTASGTVNGKTVLNKLRSFGPETLDELLGANRGKFEDELRKLAQTQIAITARSSATSPRSSIR